MSIYNKWKTVQKNKNIKMFLTKQYQMNWVSAYWINTLMQTMLRTLEALMKTYCSEIDIHVMHLLYMHFQDKLSGETSVTLVDNALVF